MTFHRRQQGVLHAILLALLIVGATPPAAFANTPPRPAETGTLKLPNGEPPEVAIDRLIKQAEAAQARGDQANFDFFRRAAQRIAAWVMGRLSAGLWQLDQARDQSYRDARELRQALQDQYVRTQVIFVQWRDYNDALRDWKLQRPAPAPGSPRAPGQALLTPLAPNSPGIQFALGGSSTHVPVVSAGTRVHGPGVETSIVDSRYRIAGVSAGADIVVPTGRTLFSFDSFTASFGFNGFDDSVRGTAPVGASSAFTYIDTNPASGSTGLGPTATGQTVTLDTRGRIWDFAFGMAGRLPAGSNAAGGTASVWTFGVGVRYRNSHIAHNIRQDSLTFADLSNTIGLDVHSNFVAPNFTAGFEVAPPLASGFFGGISAFVAPGAQIAHASATQLSRCAPCGPASPEFQLSLNRDFNQSTFAIMTGVKGTAGYQVNRAVRVVVDASYQYLGSFPGLAVPTSPLRQPIALTTSHSDMFSARGSLVFAFNP